MGLMNKLKAVKRKWLFLAAGLLMVLVVVGAAAGFHERFERRGEGNSSQAYQAYYDLLRLENTDNLKLSGEQAKALLPLIDQLSKATDETSKSDIIKNIYSNLTPQQYYSLFSDNKSIEGGKKSMGWNRQEGKGMRFKGEHGESGIYNGSIEAVVAKMLKDIAAQ